VVEVDARFHALGGPWGRVRLVDRPRGELVATR